MSNLGDLLKKLRGDRSLRNVAEVTELSHTYIADIEKGFRRGSKKPLRPSPDTLRRLAKAYNYPYEGLMSAAGYIEEDDVFLIQEKSSIYEVDDAGSEREEELLEIIHGIPEGTEREALIAKLLAYAQGYTDANKKD